jgi:hypothetical protein
VSDTEATLPPQRRVDDPRINKLVADMASVQACLASNTEITTQVRDILTSFRTIAAAAKWVAALAAAFSAVGLAVHQTVDWWRK